MSRQPLGKELGAVCCFFNPLRSRSRIRNYSLFREGIERVGLRLLTVELAFGDAPFQTEDSPDVLRLRGGDVMWQKERLLQIGGERLAAEGYSGLVLLDADVLFHEPEWPLRVVDALNRHAAVQCFSVAIRHYADMVLCAHSGVKAWQREGYLPGSAKGLAWALRSSLIKRVGLYQHCVVGGGDSALSLAALGVAHGPDAWKETLSSQAFIRRAGPTMLAHYQVWAGRFFRFAGEAAHVDGVVEALPHGPCDRRRYVDRHDMLAAFDPEREVAAGEGGAFVWTDAGEGRREPLRLYFQERREDMTWVNPEVDDILSFDDPGTSGSSEPFSSAQHPYGEAGIRWAKSMLDG
jgi:hypothetical protein